MNKATNLDRERSEPKTTSDERIPSDYPVRPGQSSCRSYLHSGLCVRGSNCLFNHPRCKVHIRLKLMDPCSKRQRSSYASNVKNFHPKDRDGEEPMRQLVTFYSNTEGKRRGSQENVKEHRQRENTGWQRYFEKKRREAQEHVREHRQKETNGRQRDSEKEKSEAQGNAQEQRLMGIAENHKVDAHRQDNLQVERQRKSIEWQTRQAQETERRKSIAFLEEQRVKDKVDKKRQRDVEKMEMEAEESSEEQRLKEKAIQDFQGLERFKDISQIHDEIVAGYIRARKMVKTFEESGEEQRLKVRTQRREDDTRTYTAGSESISMEETKERDLDSRSRKSDVTTGRRHKRDPGTWAEKREPDLITDHKESYVVDTLKQQRLGDVEMQQQRSHETESKNWATNLGWERSEPKTISDERIQNGYQVRPGERICRSYLQTGLCDHGSNCLFNHPTCKFFRRGFCTDGSACKFIHAKNNEAPRLPNNTMRQPLPSDVKILPEFSHPKDRDGAETMRQGSGRHETESAYRPDEKKCNSSLSQISVVGMVAGSSSYKEKEQRQAHDDPLELRDNTEWQRGQAQENVHEHRPRDITDCQRYYEMGRRDAQEIVQQHRQRDITEFLRYFEMGRRDAQVIVQQHRQREASGRQRYLEEEKSEAQANDQEQRLMVTTLDGRFDERRHETESSSMAEKRVTLTKYQLFISLLF
ncbi:hypothetical protein YC2023_059404 [Brassica napus]